MGVSGVSNSPNIDTALLQGAAGTSSIARANNIDINELMQVLLAAQEKQGTAMQSDMPQLPQPKSFSSSNLSGMMAFPSPGALIASLIVDSAAEQRVANRSIIQSQGESLAQNMEAQADKIREGATQKFACAVAGSVVNMAAGAASLGVGAYGIKAQLDSQTTAAMAQAVSSIISSAGSIISAGGDMAQSLRTAEGKQLEAKAERMRTSQELTKQTNEAMRDLIAKTLDFMNAMQANTNQTRTKILG